MQGGQTGLPTISHNTACRSNKVGSSVPETVIHTYHQRAESREQRAGSREERAKSRKQEEESRTRLKREQGTRENKKCMHS
jgi:hypothetical protein